MRVFSLTVAFCVALATPIAAQSDEVRAAAERYIGNPVQQQMLNDMLSPDAMVAQLRSVAPQLSEEDMQLVASIAAEEMSTIRPALEAAMITAAVETFSLDEILALEAFYATEEGASVMSKMQPFMTSSMAAITPAMQAAQGRIQSRIIEALQNR